MSSQNVADYAAVSEAFLLPYRKITTSGALQAAFTFQKGVVASDLPYFRETLGEDENAGRLFNVGDASALAVAIREYLNIPTELRATAASEVAKRHSWETVVLPVADVIIDWAKENDA